MTFDDVKIVRHKSTEAKKFSFWIFLRVHSHKKGQAARKSLINFFEQGLGPMGTRWQYQRCDDQNYILKLNDERDYLFFLLKLK